MKSKRLCALFLTATLIAPMCLLNVKVYADETKTNEASVTEATDEATASDAAQYLFSGYVDTASIKDVNAKGDDSLPEKFDLRDLGVVTPVKFQNPWGTCWGFASIAAAETSILTSMGKTYEETGLDLSEHHLTYFVNSYVDDENDPQYGEGNHMYEGESLYNTGGFPVYAASLFASGMGVVYEDDVPYRGTNSETMTGANEYLNKCYSPDDDWTLPSSLKYFQRYELKESKTFESPVVFTTNTMEGIQSGASSEEFLGLDQSVISEIKHELMDGRAVVVTFQADTFKPGLEYSVAKYLNTEDNKWTHFTFDQTGVNHAVTIVGWDDTIKSTDFLDHTNDEYGDGLAHQPEGDGAWIVKNSWGSQNSEFPNYNEWGVKDENGNSTGYFYLSYYDRSQKFFESYEFSIKDDNDIYELDQYDYLASFGSVNFVKLAPMSTANVFTAEYAGSVRSVGFNTYVSNTEVTYQVLTLDDTDTDPKNGKLMYEKTDSFEFPGYYKVDLDNPVSLDKGQKYAVVITQKGDYEGTEYYIIGIALGMYNKETTDEMNRQIRYSHRGEDPSTYEGSLRPFYAEAVINKGESLFYAEEMNGWYDLSEMDPLLFVGSPYEGFTRDNFSIKAYVKLDEAAQTEISENATGFDEYKFSSPAGKYNICNIMKLVGIILGAVLVLVVLIILIKKHNKKKKAHNEYVKSLEDKLSEYEGTKKDAEETSDEKPSASDSLTSEE